MPKPSQKTASLDRDMDAAARMKRELAASIAARTATTGPNSTPMDCLVFSRHNSATPCYRATYEPSLAVFVQGRKRVNLGGTVYHCDGSSFLLTSVEVPVEGQIVEATEEVPMLSMLLRLDMQMVREVLTAEELPDAPALTRGTALAVGETTEGMLDACCRLVRLLDSPADIPFLGRLIQREIIYRVLGTPQGERLRAIATTGDLSNRTAKAIAWLKTNYARPLHMEELAGVARMGVSTLHHQFRALTAMSPLQYQKQLRLQTARQRMLLEGMDATSAAFEVGYESVSQFNREYSRLFGQPPMRDVKSLRGAASTGLHVA